MGVAPRRCGDVGQGRRLQRVEPAERKERHIGDAVAGKIVDQGVVAPMRQIVLVLHADDLGDPASFRDLRGRDVAQPDMTHQTLPLELGQDGERRLDRPFGGAMRVEHDPKVDHVQHVEPEIAQIVVHRLVSVLRARRPGAMIHPRRAARRSW